MGKRVLGWDIGGAHLKAALLNEKGGVAQVWQWPCPLWRGIGELEQAFARALADIDTDTVRHALTMTGELADCFASRAHGVEAILTQARASLSGNVLVFAGRHGLLPLEAIDAALFADIASANWLASANLVAAQLGTALLVDIGSTTTDILLIENHQPNVIGFNDYQRLVSGELVYSGVIRTPVIAVAQQAEFNGAEMGLMAEFFATMADVYRISGDLLALHDQAETADGADKSLAASARRLSRMTGYDFTEADWPLWRDFAAYLKTRHKHKIWLACLRQIQRRNLALEPVVVGAGVGRFLIREVAAELGLRYQDFNGFFRESFPHDALTPADCAPATAVAKLAGKFG